jgi:manganese/zinc/iron transport system substrate-binding protein
MAYTKKSTMKNFLFLMAVIALITGSPLPSPAADKKLQVTTTIGMVTDLVQNIGGDRIQVTGLMGPGVDPHLYKATASDISKLQKAEVVFYNGLVLEGKLQDIFTKMARSKKFVYPITESIPTELLLEPEEFEGHYDPHVWFDVTLWNRAVDTVVKGLSEADPKSKSHYEKQGKEYKAKLDQLQKWVLDKLKELPPEKRILVTSHDAYNYFGKAYGFKVVGLQGISTVTEAGLADMAQMVDFIKSNKVKAIFVESSVPHHTIERISKDAGVKIGGELFSDAMGTPGQIENGYDLGTYEGMIKHNVHTIVEALK